MMDHRKLHSPEYQTGMHINRARPACFVADAAEVTDRGQVMEGYPAGIKPGLRNVFWDRGRACGNAVTPAVWARTLRHTPGCAACARARRSAELSSGSMPA